MAIKGYLVRGKDTAGHAVWADADDENGYEPHRGGKPIPVDSADAACFAKLEIEAQGCSDVAIFRVHDDGREERLPSYEEALEELWRVAGLDQANREAHRAIAKLKHDLEDESRRFQEARTDADVAAGLLAEARTEIERLRAIEAGLTPLERGFDFVARTLAAALIEAGETPEVHVDKLAEQAAAAIVRLGGDPLAALEAAERRLRAGGRSRSRTSTAGSGGITKRPAKRRARLRS